MTCQKKPSSTGSKAISKELLKDVIKALQEGKKPEEVKERFRSVLEHVDPTEIAKAEQELVCEGIPQEEIRKLCDVHLAIFREPLNEGEVRVSADHPIHVLMQEHKAVLQQTRRLKSILRKIDVAKSFEDVTQEISDLEFIAKHLMEIEKHNVREENVLFPYLQKHGITEPPAIMWAEHSELKEKKKQLRNLLKGRNGMAFPEFKKQLADVGDYIADALSSHIYKENHILYPAALQTIKEKEWKEIREQCDELGYCCFTPAYIQKGEKELENKGKETTREDTLSFETGNLKPEEIEALLNALPADITFVDSEDTVRYFNKAEGRVFPRTKAVIGRKVQQCHPPKSIHIVNRVVSDLKTGKRRSADFWIDMNGRKIYIRYFPVRNPDGQYIGCVEVTQDITDVKKIVGQQRLLNET